MSKHHFRASDHYGQRPDKPDGSPLFPHAAGVWAKKIRGKMHYFGTWAGQPAPDFGHAAALERYQKEKEDLHAGRTPRTDPADVTVKDVANAFLNAKQAAVDAGELAQRSWDDYKEVCALLVAHMGKGRLVSDLRQDDFASLRNKMSKRWGPHRIKKTIQVVSSIFKHAFDSELIDRPVRFGPGFARPSKKVLRVHRAEQGVNLFTAEEVRRMVGAAGAQLKAMVLLGINAGLGNSDVGNLPRSALDLDGGFLDYPRPKTGVARRCPLWPETVAALREAIDARPKPKDPADNALVFLTYKGNCWHTGTSENPLSHEVRKLLLALGLNGRKGRNFYTLRHTFRTVADEARDQPAADFIMGHEVASMSAVYRERISDERLKAVTDHVRTWLFGPAENPSAGLDK